MDQNHFFETNQALWNNKTAVHIGSAFYDNEAFMQGKNSLNPSEMEALGDVSGKSLLHLQCHFGQDTLSWARLGAKATGVDLSDAAIDQARKMNEALGLDARFIHANVYDVTEHLGDEQFDIVFTSYGTICWLPDLDKWAELIHRHLKPGGTFCIVDFHPTFNMYEWDDDTLAYSYFGNNGQPYEEVVEGSYVDNGVEGAPETSEVKGREYFWNHSLASTFQALLKQGMTLKDFTEYPYSYYKCFPNLVQLENGYWEWELHKGMLPMMFRMVFEK